MARSALSQKKKYVVTFVVLSGLLAACSDSPADSINRLNSAQNYYQQQDFASAIIELRNALKLDPNNVSARRLLGEIYFKQGNFIAADKELDNAYRLNHSDPQVVLPYAKVLLRTHNFEQFEHVLQPTMSWTVAQQDLGRSLQLIALTEQNKIAEAEELLNSPEFTTQTSADAIYARAMFYSTSNQLLLSQDLVASLLKQYPDHLEGILLQGDLFFYNKDYDNALIYYQKASSGQPINMHLKVKVVRALLGQKKLVSAAELLTKVLKSAPLYHEANYYFAHIKLQQHEYETALVYANKVLERIPGHLPSQFVAANAAYFLKRYESSYRVTRRLAEALPDNNLVLKLLAGNQLNLRLFDEAAVTLAKIDDTHIQRQDASLFIEAANSLSDPDDQQTRKELYIQAARAVPENKSVSLNLAAISFSQGSVDEGNKYLLAALAQNPDSLEIKTALISSYLNSSQFSKAQTVIEQLIADEPDNPNGYSLKGMLFLKKKDNELAISAFEQALAISPGDQNANHNLAVIAIVATNFEQAKSRYLQIIADDPGNLRALIQLSLLEKKLDNQVASLAWLGKAVKYHPKNLTINIALAENFIVEKQYQSAIDLLQPLGNKFSKDFRIPLLSGQAYYLTQQTELALDQFERAAALQPEDPTSYFWMAIIHEETRHYDKALAAANNALIRAPEHKSTLSMAVRLSLKANQLTVAEPLVNKLAALYPDDIRAQEYQARFALLNHQYKKSISLYSELFKRQKTNFTLVKLAVALVKNDQQELAFERLNEWLKQYPQDLIVLNWLAREYLTSGQLTGARQHLATIVKLTPDNSLAQNNLAWLLFKEGNFAEARVHAEQANRISPQSPMILDTLGQILLAQGNYAKSSKLLNLASNKMPENLETKFYFAQASALNGDKSTARLLLQQILSNTGNDAKVSQTLRRDSQRLLAELQN